MNLRKNHSSRGRLAFGIALFLILLLPTAAVQTLQAPTPIPANPPILPFQPANEADVTASAAPCSRSHCLYLPVAYSRGNNKQPPEAGLDRATSLLYYRTLYIPGESVNPSWNGSVDGCAPGATSATFREAIFKRINFFRRSAGIPALTRLSDTYNRKAQAAALMMSRNNTLSHDPAGNWPCYSAEGDEAAGNSNLYLGVYGPAAISGYMRDPGGGNAFLGHRRWILYPQTREMGTGDIPASGSYRPANALWLFDTHTFDSRPATRHPYVAWPPPGYVPYTTVYPNWSFSYPGADFNNATVSLRKGSSTITVTRHPQVDGYGENTLAWTINGMGDFDDWTKPSGDTRYTVTIQGVKINGKTRDFTYNVIIFDPGR